MDQNNLLLQDPTELFIRFRQGDGAAFKILYDRYFSRLCIVVKTLGPEELMEDIVSNAFIKLYDQRKAIKEPEHIYPFLFVVARNEIFDYHRQQRRQRVARETHDQLVDTEYHDPREAELEQDRWMAKINNIIDLLPPVRKKIFRLHFFDGLSIAEIANQLKLKETTVRNQRNRALLFLRQSFLL